MNNLKGSTLDISSLLSHSHLRGKGVSDVKIFLANPFSVQKVKQNPVRMIFRLDSQDLKHCFYFKYFPKISLLKRVFHFAPFIEYHTAEKITNAGIPVIPYAAWGRTQRGGVVFSYAVPSIQAREYIFKTAYHDGNLQMDFFAKLANLCKQMLDSQIIHPDFHLGNILVKTDDSSLILADPPGMHRTAFLSEKLRLALLIPWREMYGIFPDDLIAQHVVLSGLYSSSKEALKALEYATLRFRQIRNARYEHIRHQVLAGNSKYSREFITQGITYSYHHNLYFDFPDNIFIDSQWEKRDFPDTQSSERPWIQSMLFQDCNLKQPVLRVIYPDGTSSLYYSDFRSYCV